MLPVSLGMLIVSGLDQWISHIPSQQVFRKRLSNTSTVGLTFVYDLVNFINSDTLHLLA